MEFKVNSGVWGTMFGVPCIVADNFLKLATGDQLKTLLYLLRCSGRPATTEEIAANTGVKPETVSDAILFWQQANVISAENSPQPTSIMSAQTSAPPPAPTASPEVKKPAQSAVPVRRRENLYPSDISGMMKENPDLAELFKVAEAALGTLNNTMQNSLIWMTTYLGLKNEVIIVLVSYCAMIEKCHPKYIEEIAAAWAERDINTLSLAQEEVERMTSSRSYTSMIMKLFEMNRKPTSRQQEMIDRWSSESYPAELIRLAYEKTIEQIDKLNFDYINKILATWKESGFMSVEDVKNSESNFRKNRKSDHKGSSDGFDPEKYKIFINNV